MSIDDNFLIKSALREIYATYGVKASVEQKAKTLRKWGENPLVGASAIAEISNLPTGINEEPILKTNALTYVVSDSASDTMDISLIEGHTIDAATGDLTFYKFTGGITLNGQTPVALPTALARNTRVRLSSPSNGNIYVYQGGAVTAGVPNDLTKVSTVVPAGEIQTQKSSTSISKRDFWIITSATGSILERSASWAKFRIEIKGSLDDYFYPVTQWVGNSDNSGSVRILNNNEYVTVPYNHDVRIIAEADGAGTDCAAGMAGFLAIEV